LEWVKVVVWEWRLDEALLKLPQMLQLLWWAVLLVVWMAPLIQKILSNVILRSS
jgi:hypothetical protein